MYENPALSQIGESIFYVEIRYKLCIPSKKDFNQRKICIWVACL